MDPIAIKNQSLKKKVLIVDDDSDLLDMLSDIFSGAGFKVITATDGVDGTFKYSNEAFDIILTDIKMPKKDGIKFVQFIQSTESQKALKAGPLYKPTPVILISASAEDYKVEIELLKNIEVLNKPFSPKDVLDKVERLIGKKAAPAATPGLTLAYKAGEFVMKEGDEGDDIFFVKEGTLNVLKKSSNGKEVPVAGIKAGEMIGEMSFLLKKKRSASVLAITDCILIPIPREKIDAVFSGQPKWFKVLFETIVTRLDSTTEQLVTEKSKH